MESGFDPSSPPPLTSGWPFSLGLALLGLTLALSVALTSPPAALDVSAGPERFSAGRAIEVLSDLLEEDRPHPIGSSANHVVRERIIGKLTDLGLRPELRRDAVCRQDGRVCAVTENITAQIEGREPGKSVLLSAHYDSVAAGPGAGDDGSGVAVLLEIARILKAEPAPRNPVLLLINDGEEAGLLGAESFVRHDPSAAQTGAVVNVEARGTGGRNWMFETSPGGLWLIQAYSRAVSRPATSSIAYSVYKRLPNDTDLTVYKRAGLEGMGLAFLRDVQRYHTPLDDVPRLSPAALQLQGDTVLSLTRELASMDFGEVGRGEAVFFDLVGRWTIWWPEAWTLWMAWASAGLWLVAAGVTLLGARFRAGVLARAVLWWPAAVGAAGLSCWLLGKALDAFGVFPSPFVSQPEPAMLAFGGIGAAGALLAALWTSGRLEAWSLWLGGLLWWNAVSVATAWIEPGLAYPWTLPSLLAGAVSCLIVIWRRGRRAGAPAMWAGGVAAGLLLFPMMPVLYHALGRPMLPAIGLFAGMAVTWIAPLAAMAPRKIRYAVTVAVLVASSLFALVAAFVPAYSASLPQHVNIRHLSDPDGPRWIVVGQEPLPELPGPETGGAVLGPWGREGVYPWSDSEFVTAKAPEAGLPAPTVETLERGREGDQALTRVGLRSPRGASVLELRLPESAVVRELIYPGHPPLSPNPPPPRSGWRSWRFMAVPAAGLEAAILHPADGEPLAGYLSDVTSGLPPAAEPLIEAREPAVPVGAGDLTIVTVKFP